MTLLTQFRDRIQAAGLDGLRDGLIGRGMRIETPFGEKTLLFADYVASGRALSQVETFVSEHVLPYYANSHTQASFCGAAMNRLREEARATIASLVNAGPNCHVVFAGSGATAGLNRIVALLDIEARIRASEKVVVLIGPYEHHSNILPWRESGAEVIELPEAEGGGIDLTALDDALTEARGADLIVGSFSAASNVTGVLTDPDPVTRILKAHGALAIWDYAGGGPYLPMDMAPSADCAKDAIVFSAHKFPGGPAASGVMVLRDTVARRLTPTASGGGTVSFVSPWRHAYSGRIEDREEAGTPNIVGDIRAALVMLVKDAVGTNAILSRDEMLRQRALAAWRHIPQLCLLGQTADVKALPVFSFRVNDGAGGLVHHQLFTRMLSDHTGIQARGGCACAGPYAHRLLGLDHDASERLFKRLAKGHETDKPGWVRLNLSYMHSDAEADAIIQGVARLAEAGPELAKAYAVDPATARFRVREEPQRLSA